MSESVLGRVVQLGRRLLARERALSAAAKAVSEAAERNQGVLVFEGKRPEELHVLASRFVPKGTAYVFGSGAAQHPAVAKVTGPGGRGR